MKKVADVNFGKTIRSLTFLSLLFPIQWGLLPLFFRPPALSLLRWPGVHLLVYVRNTVFLVDLHPGPVYVTCKGNSIGVTVATIWRVFFFTLKINYLSIISMNRFFTFFLLSNMFLFGWIPMYIFMKLRHILRGDDLAKVRLALSYSALYFRHLHQIV